jgi:hypothetical protein
VRSLHTDFRHYHFIIQRLNRFLAPRLRTSRVHSAHTVDAS